MNNQVNIKKLYTGGNITKLSTQYSIVRRAPLNSTEIRKLQECIKSSGNTKKRTGIIMRYSSTK